MILIKNYEFFNKNKPFQIFKNPQDQNIYELKGIKKHKKKKKKKKFFFHYKKFLKTTHPSIQQPLTKRSSFDSDHSDVQQNSPLVQKKTGKWTQEEDALLASIVPYFGEKQWRKVAEYMQGRTAIQCLHRWTKILKPGLVKGPWTKQEDQTLQDWVKKEGPCKWAQAATIIKGRSGKQCRERWYNNLNPDVKKGNWTVEEDDLIFKLYLQFGSSWSKIAKYLQGRTENSIKNRFYSTARKIASDKQKVEAVGTGQQDEHIPSIKTQEQDGEQAQKQQQQYQQKPQQTQEQQEQMSSVNLDDSIEEYNEGQLEQLKLPIVLPNNQNKQNETSLSANNNNNNSNQIIISKPFERKERVGEKSGKQQSQQQYKEPLLKEEVFDNNNEMCENQGIFEEKKSKSDKMFEEKNDLEDQKKSQQQNNQNNLYNLLKVETDIVKNQQPTQIRLSKKSQDNNNSHMEQILPQTKKITKSKKSKKQEEQILQQQQQQQQLLQQQLQQLQQIQFQKQMLQKSADLQQQQSSKKKRKNQQQQEEQLQQNLSNIQLQAILNQIESTLNKELQLRNQQPISLNNQFLQNLQQFNQQPPENQTKKGKKYKKKQQQQQQQQQNLQLNNIDSAIDNLSKQVVNIYQEALQAQQQLPLQKSNQNIFINQMQPSIQQLQPIFTQIQQFPQPEPQTKTKKGKYKSKKSKKNAIEQGLPQLMDLNFLQMQQQQQQQIQQVFPQQDNEIQGKKKRKTKKDQIQQQQQEQQQQQQQSQLQQQQFEEIKQEQPKKQSFQKVIQGSQGINTAVQQHPELQAQLPSIPQQLEDDNKVMFLVTQLHALEEMLMKTREELMHLESQMSNQHQPALINTNFQKQNYLLTSPSHSSHSNSNIGGLNRLFRKEYANSEKNKQMQEMNEIKPNNEVDNFFNQRKKTQDEEINSCVGAINKLDQLDQLAIEQEEKNQLKQEEKLSNESRDKIDEEKQGIENQMILEQSEQQQEIEEEKNNQELTQKEQNLESQKESQVNDNQENSQHQELELENQESLQKQEQEQQQQQLEQKLTESNDVLKEQLEEQI